MHEFLDRVTQLTSRINSAFTPGLDEVFLELSGVVSTPVSKQVHSKLTW
jgi:hypothetical protein